MVYKRFTVLIAIQLTILTSFLALGFWAMDQDHLSFTRYGFFGLAFLQLVYIVYFIHKSNRDILKFLQNFVIDEAFPRYKNSFKESSFRDIEEQLNRIASSYGKVKLEKEAEHQFLQHLIEHMDIAIIALDEQEKVLLMNSNAKDLLLTTITKLDHLEKVSVGLSDKVRNLQPGNPEVVRLPDGSFIKPYSLRTTHFTLNKEKIKIISFNDIDKELVKEELDNWQTLIRILRHEIINSITPITTLSEAMNDNYSEEIIHVTDDSAESRLLQLSQKGFEAISKRGKGLLSFVDRFKMISSMPEPEKKEINVDDLFYDIHNLMKNEFQKQNICFEKYIASSDLKFLADEKLITQVLINLLKNAIEATEGKEEKKIYLEAECDINSMKISVKDNGMGIPKENLEKIFVPFYTTKEKGSGIGLSFARLVMHKHDGQILISSTYEQSTRVDLIFL